MKALALASVLWPALLAGGTVAELRDHQSRFAPVVYLAGSVICHQKPDRSFFVRGVQWPVCARCSGLYLAAPLGVLLAVSRPVAFRRPRHLRWLALAALPTAMTMVLEYGGLSPMTSLARFLAALPLGAAIAWVIVTVAGSPQPIE